MQWKNLVKIVAFCTILAFLINGTYKALAWKDTAGAYISSVESLYDLEEDVVDVLFLGSSHCYCTINNATLWEEQGIAGFSLAISGQDIASTYHCLVEALKTQTPKVICVEAYNATIEGYGVVGNLYRNTLSLKYSANFYNAVNSMVAEEEKADYWLKWPIIHTRYAELQRGDFQRDYPAYLGYSAGFETNPMSEVVLYEGNEPLAIPEESEMWLRKIIALAKENHIPICLFLSPCIAGEKEQRQFLYIEQIAREEGAAYLNTLQHNAEIGIDVSKDFIDGNHTNYFGSQKVTKYMGEYLKDNYVLEDRRGDSRYQLWEEDAEIREHEWQNHLLQSVQDVKGYLDLIGTMKNYTVLIATSGEYQVEGFDLYDCLQTAGIGEEFYESDRVWIFDNQQLTYTSSAANLLEHQNLAGGGDLLVSSNAGAKSIVINKQECKKVNNGINIVVYDNLLDIVVDKVGFTATQQYAVVR